jgi:hypothetical protein
MSNEPTRVASDLCSSQYDFMRRRVADAMVIRRDNKWLAWSACLVGLLGRKQIGE